MVYSYRQFSIFTNKKRLIKKTSKGLSSTPKYYKETQLFYFDKQFIDIFKTPDEWTDSIQQNLSIHCKTQIEEQLKKYFEIPELIRNGFNESFKDYFVPFHLSVEQFANKITTEAIDLSLSFGAFDNSELVGFILNGVDTIDGIKTTYNAGTGILPQHRGKGLSRQLYDHCIDEFEKAGIERSVLEVFQQNKPAIKTYQNVGFNITRVINSYKGRAHKKDVTDIVIKESKSPDWSWINTITAWQPAWQYHYHSLRRGWQQYRLFIAYDKDEPVAFVIFNPANGRVAQFGAVNFFGESIPLTALFAHIDQLTVQELTVVHVGSVEAENFLQSLGLQLFIYSYEMERMC